MLQRYINICVKTCASAFEGVAAVSLDPAFSLSARRSSALALEDAEIHVRSAVSGTRRLHTSCKTSQTVIHNGEL